MKSSQVVKLRVEEKRDDKGEITRWERGVPSTKYR